MKLAHVIADYHYATYDLSPNTRRWYEHKLRAFATWTEREGVSELEEITPALVRRYLVTQRDTPSPATGKPRSSYTRRGDAQVIKGFLTWCVREELIAEKIAQRIELPRVEIKVIETFSAAQIKLLFAACAQEMTPTLATRDRAILSVLLDTGVRASELCGLTLDQTVLSPQDAYLRVTGKGRKQREVGLGNTARITLHRYLYRYRDAPAGERHVFVSRQRQALTPSGLDQLIYRLADRAGIEGVRCSAHTFRHTYAVDFLAAGGDVYALSRLLGHSSVSVTETYLRAYRSREARKGLSVLDNMK